MRRDERVHEYLKLMNSEDSHPTSNSQVPCFWGSGSRSGLHISVPCRHSFSPGESSEECLTSVFDLHTLP